MRFILWVNELDKRDEACFNIFEEMSSYLEESDLIAVMTFSTSVALVGVKYIEILGESPRYFENSVSSSVIVSTIITKCSLNLVAVSIHGGCNSMGEFKLRDLPKREFIELHCLLGLPWILL